MDGGFKCPEKGIRKVYGSTLLALPAGVWVSNFQKKCKVTLELPPKVIFRQFKLWTNLIGLQSLFMVCPISASLANPCIYIPIGDHVNVY